MWPSLCIEINIYQKMYKYRGTKYVYSIYIYDKFYISKIEYYYDDIYKCEHVIDEETYYRLCLSIERCNYRVCNVYKRWVTLKCPNMIQNLWKAYCYVS
jgi:hypothetical protein